MTEKASKLTSYFLFSSETRAEEGVDEIEDELIDSDEDVDIDDIRIDGDMVIVESTLYERRGQSPQRADEIRPYLEVVLYRLAESSRRLWN